MRKKSETMEVLQRLIRSIEKKFQRKLSVLDAQIGFSEAFGVSSLRCDNAGENVLTKMKEWCGRRGITMETSIPHTPYQNGKAERLGGERGRSISIWWQPAGGILAHVLSGVRACPK